MSSKGQMFISVGILVSITIIILRTSIDFNKLIDNKKSLELGLERKEFVNVRNEIVGTVDNSILSVNSIVTNANNFINFVVDAVSGKGQAFSGLSVQTIFPNATANTLIRFNVTVMNFFDSEIRQLNLSFSSDLTANQSFANLGNRKVLATNFTFNTGSATNYTLIVYYLSNFENQTNSFTIPVELNKGKYVGFFDLRLKTLRTEYRDNFIVTRTLP